jgi:hypothetical protein
MVLVRRWKTVGGVFIMVFIGKRLIELFVFVFVGMGILIDIEERFGVIGGVFCFKLVYFIGNTL